MKVPRYIKDKLVRRAKYGRLVNRLDTEIQEWVESKGITLWEIFDDPFQLNSILLVTEPVNLAVKQYEMLKNYNKG